MSKKIIAVVGQTGSGKDTFCDILKKKHPDALLVRFSDPLSKILGIFFDGIKKEDQQWLASTLRDRFGEDILMKAMSRRLEKAEEQLILVNGIRVKEELEAVKEKGGLIVYISLDVKTRWERVKERNERKDDDVDFEKFLQIDEGRTEVQIKDMEQKADVVIDNSGTLEDLREKCEKLIKETDE